MRKAEAREALAKAKAVALTALAKYNATWRKHPTAKGFPLVDKALDALHEAEADQAACERQLAEAW